MATKDYRVIGNALRYRFTKEHPQGSDSSKEYLPSILAVSADVIDCYNKAKNKMKCRMDSANCSIDGDCAEDCCCKKRVFYGYRDDHFLIFQEPEKLDASLRIDNHFLKQNGNPLCELYAKSVYELAFQVLYQYYEVMPWSTCYWHIDYYEEILASIFLFCPKILCYAIKEELKVSDKAADIHVLSAIQKCLDFSIRLDKKTEEERMANEKRKKERMEFYCKTLNEIINFHILRDVETALIRDFDQNSEIVEVVKKAIEVSSDVVSETRRILSEWSKQNSDKRYEKNLRKIMGRDNYNYIYRRCVGTS